MLMVRTTAYRSAELWTQGEKLVRALAFCIFFGVRVLDCILSFIKNFTSPIFSSRAHLAQLSVVFFVNVVQNSIPAFIFLRGRKNSSQSDQTGDSFILSLRHVKL